MTQINDCLVYIEPHHNNVSLVGNMNFISHLSQFKVNGSKIIKNLNFTTASMKCAEMDLYLNGGHVQGRLSLVVPLHHCRAPWGQPTAGSSRVGWRLAAGGAAGRRALRCLLPATAPAPLTGGAAWSCRVKDDRGHLGFPPLAWGSPGPFWGCLRRGDLRVCLCSVGTAVRVAALWRWFQRQGDATRRLGLGSVTQDAVDMRGILSDCAASCADVLRTHTRLLRVQFSKRSRTLEGNPLAGSLGLFHVGLFFVLQRLRLLHDCPLLVDGLQSVLSHRLHLLLPSCPDCSRVLPTSCCFLHHLLFSFAIFGNLRTRRAGVLGGRGEIEHRQVTALSRSAKWLCGVPSFRGPAFRNGHLWRFLHHAANFAAAGAEPDLKVFP